jgi:hypothetical protein
MLPDYAQSVGPVQAMLAAHFGRENSDPDRIAGIVLKLAACAKPPLHLLLGSDSLQYCAPSEAQRKEEGERWVDMTRSADATATGPIPECPAA